MSGVQQFNGSVADASGCNRKLEVRDSGHKTGTTYISACRSDSNESSTATPMFSRSSISIMLLEALYGLTVSRKPKMAATKPELLTSRLFDKIEIKFRQLKFFHLL
jgi:hypothetical protein